MPSEKEKTILELGRDPVLAHAVLFGDKHSEPTPAFHREIISDWHSDALNVGTMAFRGAAKSTLAEEAISIMCCFQRVRNVLILGESEQRAVERLRAIKHIFEQNEWMQALFELGPGDIWTEAKVTLSNGIILQAYGRGQSLRGVKHLDSRPDLIFMDDLEDNDSVATPEARDKTLVWYTSTVVPTLTPGGRKRMGATPLHPEALAPKLAKAPGWEFKTYPIVYVDNNGEKRATWPERYPVEWAEQKRRELDEVGKSDLFVQEYMCQAQNPATQTFTPEMIRVAPHIRSWHAVYAMYDPARTTHKTSATTGKVVWSWIGRKLIIWDAAARKWMPDEIVEDIFAVDDTYRPVAIGIEETGLNEFLLQPIRTEQRRRGHTVPLRALHAPKGKLDFIRALQPYFRAGEVEFAQELPELRAQLLGFPSGDIDAPNALAYALKMRMGLPVYDGFNSDFIAAELKLNARAPLWLSVNSDGRATTAVLCQIDHGVLSVFADWLHEGDPGTCLRDIVQEAFVELPNYRQTNGKYPAPLYQASPLKLIAPQTHWDMYGSIGLRAAAKKIPAEVQRGGDVVIGREELRRLFRTLVHGGPGVQIAERATWTLRAFAGGFCRQADKPEPEDNTYRVLMEGLECFTAKLRAVSRLDSGLNFDYTAEGRKYLSARAR